MRVRAPSANSTTVSKLGRRHSRQKCTYIIPSIILRSLHEQVQCIIYGKRLLDHERYAKRTNTYGSVHGAALRKGSLRTAANLRSRNRATGTQPGDPLHFLASCLIHRVGFPAPLLQPYLPDGYKASTHTDLKHSSFAPTYGQHGPERRRRRRVFPAGKPKVEMVRYLTLKQCDI